MTPFEREVFDVVREALMLPDTPPAGFSAESNLFESFGLDSVDALEIVMVLRKRYGVEFNQEDEEKKQIFSSLGRLAAHVAAGRTAGA
jgi:acyl carrier protein